MVLAHLVQAARLRPDPRLLPSDPGPSGRLWRWKSSCAFMDPAESPHVTFDLEWVPGGQTGHPPSPLAREYTQSSVPRTGVCPALDHMARPLAHRPARPLLLPTGREANTINQLLADENMRKQNAYVEVGAKDWGPSPKGRGRQESPWQRVPN